MYYKLQIILNIVKEYFKIVDLFIKSEEVFGNQVVLYKKRERMLKEKMHSLLFFVLATFNISLLYL